MRGNWRWLRAREESAPQDFPPRAGHLQGPIQNERGNREGKREGACRQGPIQIERGNRERNRERAQVVQGPIQIERGNRDGKREGAGRRHLESSAAALCSSSCVRPLLQSSGSCPIHAGLPLLVGFLCSAFPSAGLLVAHWYLFLSRPLLCSLRHAWTLDMLCSCSCSSVLPEVGYEHTVV